MVSSDDRSSLSDYHNVTGNYIATWNFGSIYYMFVLFAVLAANIPVLAAYLLNPQLRANTFSIYLMNLLTANLFHAFIEHPLDIISLLYPSHSPLLCMLYIYAVYGTGATMLNCHLLITINRIWAIAFPFHYRSHHTRTAAGLLCVGVWVYVHALVLPGVLIDALTNRYTADNVYCLANLRIPAVDLWQKVIQVLLYVLPILTIALAYPYILWRHQKQTFRKVASVTMAATFSRHRPAASSMVNRLEKSFSTANKSDDEIDNAVQKQRSTSVMVLTLLTISVVVCWAPITVFFCLSTFGSIVINQLYNITLIWFVLQPVIDPILFVIALKDLRTSLTGRNTHLGKSARRTRNIELH